MEFLNLEEVKSAYKDSTDSEIIAIFMQQWSDAFSHKGQVSDIVTSPVLYVDLRKFGCNLLHIQIEKAFLKAGLMANMKGARIWISRDPAYVGKVKYYGKEDSAFAEDHPVFSQFNQEVFKRWAE